MEKQNYECSETCEYLDNWAIPFQCHKYHSVGNKMHPDCIEKIILNTPDEEILKNTDPKELEIVDGIINKAINKYKIKNNKGSESLE